MIKPDEMASSNLHNLTNVTSDLLGDGTVGLDEYRSDCVKRMAYKSIKDLDAAYEKLLSVSIYKRSVEPKH